MFIGEGAYSNLCQPGDDINSDGTCPAQLQQLNMMYTLSMSVLNAMTLPVGLFIGKTGPMLMCMMGSLLIGLGSDLFFSFFFFFGIFELTLLPIKVPF